MPEQSQQSSSERYPAGAVDKAIEALELSYSVFGGDGAAEG